MYWLFFIAFALFICYFAFPFLFFKNILGIFFWSKFLYFIEEFSNDCLSMPINNQLWHVRVGLFNTRLNKPNKTIFPLYLSSDLSKRLTCILLLNLQSTYQLCNFLLISVVLHCLYIKNFFLLKSRHIESNTGPRKSPTLKFFQWNLNGLAAH